MSSVRDRWEAAKAKTTAFFHKATSEIPWAAANVALGFLAGGALFPFLSDDPIKALSGLLGGASTNIITAWLLEYTKERGTDPKPAEYIAALGEALEESRELRLAVEELVGKFGAGELIDKAKESMSNELRQQFLQLVQEEWARFRQAGEFSTFEPTPSGTLVQKIENPTLIREGDHYYFTTDQRQWIGVQFQAPIYGSVIIPTPEPKPLPRILQKGAIPINNLPQREPFFGRTSELRDIEESLSPFARTGLISIEGIGGSGKTALALEAAHRALDAKSFDAIIWTTAKEQILTWAGIQILAPDFTTADGLFNRILVLLNESGKVDLRFDHKWEHVLKLLIDRRCLLVVDNLETVSDHDVFRFLVKIPQPSKAIVTNRHAPAPLREAHPVILERGMEREPAYELLRNEAENLGVRSIRDAKESVLEEVFERTYGWPMVMKWVVWQVWQGKSIEGTLDRLAETSENDLHEFIFQESYKVLGSEGIQVIQALAAIGSATNEDSVCYIGELKLGIFERGWKQIWRTRLGIYDDQHHLYSLHPMTRDFVLGMMDRHQRARLDARVGDLPIKLVYDKLDKNERQTLWSLASFDKAVSSRIWLSASQLDDSVFKRGVDQLVRFALVSFDHQRQLYSLHPKVRSFVLDQLDKPTRDEWLARAQAAIPDLKALRRIYLAYLTNNYGWLDFRGIAPVSRLLKVPLMSVYVPLKIRVQQRGFESWLGRPTTAHDPLSRENIDTKGIGQLIREQRRIVILGDPGSGKTTLLRYLALALAEDPQSIERRLGINEELLPILIPLAAYASALQQEPGLSLNDFLPRYFAAQGLPELLPLFEDELVRGHCLVLIDGLDEVVSHIQRLQVVRNVESFVNRFDQNRFVVTSRVVGYREAPLAEGWYHVTLVDFGMAEIEHFVKAWLVSYQLALTDKASTAEIQAEREARLLLSAIAENSYISALATNPLLLTVIILVYRQGLSLPEHRITLYESCVNLLLETWNYSRSLSERIIGVPLDSLEVVRILSQVALRIHETAVTGLVSETELRSMITEIMLEWGSTKAKALQTSEEFIGLVRHQGTIFLERGAGVYGFTHVTFEEYLAARALAAQREYDRNMFVIGHLSETAWHEVIRLLLARLSLIEGKRLEVSDLLRIMMEAETIGAEQRGMGVILAGEVLRDVGVHSVEPQIRDLTISRLRMLFRDSLVSLSSRLAAGTILGELGFIPADLSDMIGVPAGPFVMGSNPKKYEDEQPVHEVILASFMIRKYPVTNLEYREFVENDGYQAQRFWTYEGWRYVLSRGINAPEYWDDGLWNNPNYPVVGISWHEARAYCAWLTDKLHAQGDLGHDEIIRLPTEAEWEKAAQGVGRREWPWGDEFDSSRANTAESKIGRTTPVGAYPSGASPYGLEEMSGNVWEWCSSLYQSYPYQADDGRENLEGDGQRVLRGGSWGDDHNYARTKFRGKALPDVRFSTIGFRYVRAKQSLS
jgi:formylglycine-generating enzyme required for sulfatase activity/energy-coupling factor transporter ATP-binding protein EcfA2